MPILGSTERAREIKSQALERAYKSGRLRRQASGGLTYDAAETSSSCVDEFDSDATEPMSPLNLPHGHQHDGTADSPISLEDTSDEEDTKTNVNRATGGGARNNDNKPSTAATAAASANRPAAVQSSSSAVKASMPKSQTPKATKPPATVTNQKSKKRSTVSQESPNLNDSDSDADDILSQPTFQAKKSRDKGVGKDGSAKRKLYPSSAGRVGMTASNKNSDNGTTMKAPPRSSPVASADRPVSMALPASVQSENNGIHRSIPKLEKEKIAAEIELLREQAATARFERKVSMLKQYNKLLWEDKWSHNEIVRTFPELIVFFPSTGIASSQLSNSTGDKDRISKKARR